MKRFFERLKHWLSMLDEYANAMDYTEVNYLIDKTNYLQQQIDDLKTASKVGEIR